MDINISGKKESDTCLEDVKEATKENTDKLIDYLSNTSFLKFLIEDVKNSTVTKDEAYQVLVKSIKNY